MACRLISILVILIVIIYYIVKFFAYSGPDGDGGGNGIPVVMWHGMGDTCCLPISMGAVKKMIQAYTNDTYVKSLMIGGNIVLDYESGFFMHPNKQVEYACNAIAVDEKLRNGYHAIGFSQGAQFLRAVAQRCPKPPMKNLISVGGQHQGIFGLPKCPSLSAAACEELRKLLNYAAYEETVQNDLTQATYWHNPLKEDDYRMRSTFLNDINNELEKGHNERYAENLNKLEKFVMIKFLNDTIVQPKETQWFEFYKPGQDIDILPLNQSRVFERLGLAQMHLNGKLKFLAVEGDHLKMSKDWFVKNIIPLLL